MRLKKVIPLILCSFLSVNICMPAKADGKKAVYSNALPADTVAVEDMLSDITAESFAVVECTTGKVLFEKNADEKRSISHLAKLMTLLVTAENIQHGKLEFTDKATVSKYANSMNGSQIWLDVGEKISIEELVKSITVGNANDACVTLAEKIGGSEQDFVSIMNKRAAELGMTATSFADSTGISEKTVSTAHDMAALCRELSKHENLKQYLTTWIDNVRSGKAELVNLNRLVRSYKGITGMKACFSKDAGECVCSSAKRGNMSVCAVILGSNDEESKFSEAKKLMDMSFQFYELYMPEIPKELLENIKITGGEVLTEQVTAEKLPVTVIPRGTSGSIEFITKREESLSAPVKKGDKAGSFVCKMGDEVIISTQITVKHKVDKMNIKCGLYKLLCNLLNLKA